LLGGGVESDLFATRVLDTLREQSAYGTGRIVLEDRVFRLSIEYRTVVLCEYDL
jgi:hypothetical protein